jgi:hypothetical protein
MFAFVQIYKYLFSVVRRFCEVVGTVLIIIRMNFVFTCCYLVLLVLGYYTKAEVLVFPTRLHIHQKMNANGTSTK